MTDHLKAPTHLVSPQVLAPHVCITVCALDEFYIYSVKLELATVVPIVKQRGLFGWICVSLLGLVHRMTRAPTIVSFVVDAGGELAAKDATRATSKGPGDTCFCPRVSAPLGLAGPHLALSVDPGRQS